MSKIDQSIGRVLFDDQSHYLKLRTVSLLHNDHEGDSFALIVAAMNECGGDDWEVVSQAMVATTGFNPHRLSGKWLNLIKAKLMRDEEAGGQVSRAFVLGTVLGLFDSANWLDTHWRTETEFERELPALLKWLVVDQTHLDRRVVGVEEAFVETAKQYQGQLSQAIQTYALGKNMLQYIGGRRWAQMHALLREAADIIERRWTVAFQKPKPDQPEIKEPRFKFFGKDGNLSLGEYVLDQLAHALFLRLGPEAKTVAAARTMSNIINTTFGKKIV